MYTVLEINVLTSEPGEIEEMEEKVLSLKKEELNRWFSECSKTLKSLEQKMNDCQRMNRPGWSLHRGWEIVSDFQQKLLEELTREESDDGSDGLHRSSVSVRCDRSQKGVRSCSCEDRRDLGLHSRETERAIKCGSSQ